SSKKPTTHGKPAGVAAAAAHVRRGRSGRLEKKPLLCEWDTIGPQTKTTTEDLFKLDSISLKFWRRREGSNLWPGPSCGLSDQRVAAVAFFNSFSLSFELSPLLYH